MNSNELSDLEKQYNIVMRPPSTTPPPLKSPEENLSEEQLDKESKAALKYFQEKEKQFKSSQNLKKYFQETEKRNKFTESLKEKLQSVYIEQETNKEIKRTVHRFLKNDKLKQRSPYLYYGMRIF